MGKHSWKLFLGSAGLLILILDAKTAVFGASEGIALCICTVIPSLFPFIFISAFLVSHLAGKNHAMLNALGNILKMPRGSEGFLLVGFLGGYPTGAVCIADSYRSGKLKRDQAERLLGFCSNAGPAFLFGMASSMFTGVIPWIIWGIHILSACMTARILPKIDSTPVQTSNAHPITVTAALNRALSIMVTICGWVILFRILIAFCNRWFLWRLPETLRMIVIGTLELSNGCCTLSELDSSALRFILFSVFLSFGGLCVAMQTRSAVEPLSLRWYFFGKFIQCISSTLLCLILLPILFPAQCNVGVCIYLMAAFSAILTAIKIIFSKKTVAFPICPIYNEKKASKRLAYAVSKKN